MNTGNTLFLITARGGSRGIPGKNIKKLGGKPLLYYTIDVAREITSDENICLSTDSDNIISAALSYGLKVPFKRPANLATDSIGSYEVLLHAIDHYTNNGHHLDTLVLLQPTSPFRKAHQVREAMNMYTSNLDMVVSVCRSESNPYYNLYEKEKGEPFIHLSKEAHFERRQDAPEVYTLNGAIYVINVSSLKKSPISKFRYVMKYEMDPITSVDIDTMLDWQWAEFLLENRFI